MKTAVEKDILDDGLMRSKLLCWRVKKRWASRYQDDFAEW